MQDGEDDLRDDVLGRDEVDVVHAAYVLQFEVPFTELFGGEVEAVALVGDVVVLAEDAAEVAAAEEDAAGAVLALYTWFYTRRYLSIVLLLPCR